VVAKAVSLLKVADPSSDQAIGAEALLARNDRYGFRLNSLNSTRPDRQQIGYAFALRSARVGWTPALREEYFSWFNQAYPWTGGLSFNGFINNTRLIALAGVDDLALRQRLADRSKRPVPAAMAEVASPKGPGRNYSVEEATAAVRGQLTGRNFNQGSAMFAATACVVCHRMGATGAGTAGPVLTQAGSRYSERDLLEAIIHPSASVNENYASTQFEMKDGSTLVGQLTFEEGDELFISANPMAPEELTLVKADDVKSTKPYETSVMPPGLINELNEEELRDLVAYILSGGNPSSPMFSPVQR
jgi:putative heme-binding domain-containing protein